MRIRCLLLLVLLLLAACQPADAPQQPAAETSAPQTRQITLLTPAGETVFDTRAGTVGEALREAGFAPDERDLVWPPLQTPLDADMTVEYHPARQITVRVDGQEITVKASGETVGQVLASAGIALVGLDYSLPAESAPAPVEGAIQIVRVRETLSLAQKSIPFQTQYVDAPEVPLGIEEILSPGKPGVLITRTRIRYEDGQETARFEEAEAVVQPPQDRLSGRGTKISLQTVPGTQLQFWRAISMYATSYSPCRSGVPDRCFYGTAGGLPVQRGVVAMTRLWFNQLRGTQVYIPGYGVAVVSDVGGGFPDGRPWIDLGFSDDDFETWSGWITVYFLAPAPQEIPYFLK